MCAKSQFSRLSSKQERLERLNRARDFFGNPVQRGQDRLTFKGKSHIEEYRGGRMALVLHLKISPGALRQKMRPGSVSVQNSFDMPLICVLVLKADTRDVHTLQEWNKELMFVPNIQVLQGPERIIPSLVGFYVAHEEILHYDLDLLLFEHVLEGGFQFISGLANRESCIPAGRSATFSDDIVPENVQGASQIMKSVPNHHCGILGWRCERIIEEQMQRNLSIEILIDAQEIKITRRDPFIEIVNVLRGPLNFYP